MGNFYTNITVMGPSQEEVVDYLRATRRDAYVSPTTNWVVVVYDRECEMQDERILSRLAADISKTLRCVTWAVLNHDDDLLWYELFKEGTRVDAYDSSSRKLRGNAAVLAEAFGHGERAAEVEEILKRSFVFAVDRHEGLVAMLSLDFRSVGIGFDDVEAVAGAGAPLPDGSDSSRFVRVGC
jgi:hypothetical protein